MRTISSANRFQWIFISSPSALSRRNEYFAEDTNVNINTIKYCTGREGRHLENLVYFSSVIRKIWRDRERKREGGNRRAIDRRYLNATIISGRRALRRQVGIANGQFWVTHAISLPPAAPLIYAANWFNWFCTRYVIIDACKRWMRPRG